MPKYLTYNERPDYIKSNNDKFLHNDNFRFAIRFLKEENAYQKFKVNLIKASEKNHCSPLQKMLGHHTSLNYENFHKRPLYHIISSAFCWIDTPQGDSYWLNLNEELNNEYQFNYI